MDSSIGYVPEVDSTNAFIKETLKNNPYLLHGLCLCTDYQTKGKGQPGNFWESERSKNLLFSILIQNTKIEIQEQFFLSEIVSLSLKKVLEQALGQTVQIKWPNDIYVGDKKISGILIENQLQGNRLTSCIIGVGLNVNQTAFMSAAPNPVSMIQLCNKEQDRVHLLADIHQSILELFEIYPKNKTSLHRRYMEALYHGQGVFQYQDTTTHEYFSATITNIAYNGTLTLTEPEGKKHHYLFKEVKFILPNHTL